MCAQCLAGAAACVGSASGVRAWLATRPWMTPVTLRRATIILLSAGVLASSLALGSAGSAPAPETDAESTEHRR